MFYVDYSSIKLEINKQTIESILNDFEGELTNLKNTHM